MLLVVIACALVVARAGTSATVPVPDARIGGGTSGFLGECASLPERRSVDCYIRGLLAAVEQGGNPAHSVPAIDARVHETGGFLEAACHSFMHTIGRTWAKRHAVTIGTLFKYEPRSNDPGCSGGFGMGMAMYLGPQIITKPRSILPTCAKLQTRYQVYTCIHGSGHAFMRGFHGTLPPAIAACKTLGPARAPDCAQGAFHDYWISLGGGDGTRQEAAADTHPASVCSAFEFKRPCWYRYFWEREPSTRVDASEDVLGQCDGLDGLDRAGCVSGASLLAARAHYPVDHARMCTELSGVDVYNCLRGVNVPSLDGNRFEQLRLIRTCGGLSTETRWWCYGWFGRTLAVLTNGAFQRIGCSQLATEHEQLSCRAGAARMWKPLRTFS